MADYSGTAPVGYGEGSSGQYYKQVSWEDGVFYITDDDEHASSSTTLTNGDHRDPKYYVDFTLDKNKQLTVTFKSRQTSSAYFFGYRVGYEAWDDDHKNDVIRCISTNIWNWRGNANIADSDLTLDKADLSNLNFPIYIRAICDGCPTSGYKGSATSSNKGYITGFAHYISSPKYGEDGAYGGGAYKIVKQHTHIAAPNPPVVVKSSGTTITIKCDPNDSASSNKGRVKKADSTTWYASTNDGVIFTGFEQNSIEDFVSARYCGDDCTDGDKYIESTNATTARTWYIDASVYEINTNELAFNVMHFSNKKDDYGYDTDAQNTPIICALYKSNADRSSDTNRVATKEFTGGISVVRFNGLTSGTVYYLRAWSKDIVNSSGTIDNFIDISATTENSAPFKIAEHNVFSSATTISASIKIQPNGSTITSSIKCNGEEKKISNITGTSYTHKVGFTNLEKGTEYEVTFTVEDTSGNKYNTAFTIKTKSTSALVTKISSSALRIKAMSNGASSLSIALYDVYDTEKYGWENIERDGKKIFYNLSSDTSYICKVKINNCFKYDESGNVTTVEDSISENVVNTYALHATIVEPYIYQDAVTFNVHSYVTLSASSDTEREFTSDNITEEPYKITGIRVTPVIEWGYQTPSDTTTKNISTPSGGYSISQRVSVHELDYYTKYQISAEIYDGYNKVWSKPLTIYTSFPYSTIYINGRWRNVMPYIYTNNEWKPAVMHLNSDGEWVTPDSDTL